MNQKALSLLALFFFLSIFISQSLMDFLSALLIVAFIVDQIKEKKWLFVKTQFEVLWLVWIVIIGLGFLLNASPEAPWLTKIFEFKWILHIYVFIWALQKMDYRAAYFQKTLMGGLLLLGGYGLWTSLTGIDILKPHETIDKIGFFYRTGGLFSNPMIYAHVYGFAFLFLLSFSFYSFKEKKKDILLYLTTTVWALSLLLTFTRGVWLSLTLAVLFMCFCLGRKFFFKMTGILVLLGAVLVLSWSGLRDRLTQSFDPQRSYDNERVVLWKTNLEIFKDFPVLGIGYGENKRRLPEYFAQLGYSEGQFKGHAHNQFLHFLAGTGVLGALCYLFFMSQSLWRSVKSFQTSGNPALALGLCGAIAHWIAGGLFEANYEHSKIKYLIALCIALLVYIEKERKTHHEN